MSIEELQLAVKKLPPAEFAEFAAFIADYQAELWDREIESDFQSGRLDHFIARAEEDIAAGRSKPL